MSKFAAMTAGLLVRKEGVLPPIIAATAWMPKRPAREERPIAVERRFDRKETQSVPRPSNTAPKKKPRSEGDTQKPRRIVLNLSAREFETLGLIAVKKNTTRHQLAQEALDVFFDTLADEYGAGCLCIDPCRRNCDA